MENIRNTVLDNRFLACTSVSVCGVALARIHLWYLLEVDVVFAATVSGALVPFGLALGIVYTGYWAYHHEYETEYVVRLCMWAWGGGICLTGVGLLIVIHNYTLSGQLSMGYFLTLAYMATVGVLVGTVIGNSAIGSLRQQILATERSKDQLEFFNSILRHDMLNGMNVIHGRALLLVDSLDGTEEAHAETILEWADDIVDLGQKVRSILDSITDDEEVRLSAEDLSSVVREQADIASSMEDEATVETDIENDVMVEANDLLDEVVHNVVTNAVAHNDADRPVVQVTLENGKTTSTLRVADNGSGVDDDRKEKIFVRGETSNSEGGFGLYFVKTMIESYGGDIRVEDNDPTGAVFVMEFPTHSES